MKINIDLQCYNRKGTGISEYAKSRISFLEKINDVSLFGYMTKGRHNEELNSFERLHFPIKIGRLPIKLLYSRKIKHPLPIYYEYLCKNHADINLYFTWNIKRVKHKGITIATIHDLIALRTEMENQKIVDDQINDLTYTLKYCDFVFTVSNASKADIIKEFNYPAERIGVVPNGIDYDRFHCNIPEHELLRIRGKYGLPQKFILYLGGMRKHKNLDRLIRAYSCLSEELKEEYSLVITKGTPELKELAWNLHIGDKVVFTPYIEEEDKIGMYKLASLYAYISLYEGFGLPVIESQAVGTPVITSNVSSLPEVAGDSALCVNPLDIKEIAEGITRILSDNELRQKMINKGFANAQYYNDNNAGEILYGYLKNIVCKGTL